MLRITQCKNVLLVCTVVVLNAFSATTHAQNYLAQAKVVNNVDGAVVKQIVYQFYFREGGQYYCDKPTNVEKGEAGYCDSNTNTKCTFKGGGVARVKYNGQVFGVVLNDTPPIPENECWILIPYEINTNLTISNQEQSKEKTHLERLAESLSCDMKDPKTGQIMVNKCTFIDIEEFDAYAEKLREDVK